MPEEPGSCGNFSRDRRLTSSEDFKRVFAENCRTHLPGLVVLSQPNGLTGPRLGLAISRKYARRAVDRNRVKRQIRESFRLHQAQLGSRDFVVVARSGLEKQSSSFLRAELDRHWAVHIQRCANSSSP